jgi:hypothetical protein
MSDQSTTGSATSVTHCLQLETVATDRESRAVLKEMAAEWLKLADAPVD